MRFTVISTERNKALSVNHYIAIIMTEHSLMFLEQSELIILFDMPFLQGKRSSILQLR